MITFTTLTPLGQRRKTLPNRTTITNRSQPKSEVDWEPGLTNSAVIPAAMPGLTAGGTPCPRQSSKRWALISSRSGRWRPSPFPGRILPPSPRRCRKGASWPVPASGASALSVGPPGRGWSEGTGHINRREAAHVPHNAPTKTDSTGWKPTRVGTLCWRPTCGHQAPAVPALVLDPFAGSGTTLAVAQRLGRRAVGVDLNPDYLEMARKRIGAVTLPMPWGEANGD